MTGAQLSLRSLSDASYAASSSTGATNSASASSGGSVNDGAAGKKREQRTAERQEHRIRRSDAARGSRQNHRGDEQAEKLFESVMSAVGAAHPVLHRSMRSTRSPHYRSHVDGRRRARSGPSRQAVGDQLLSYVGYSSGSYLDGVPWKG